MAWAHVQTVQKTGISTTSGATSSITTTTGGCIVLGITGFRTGGFTVSSVSDGTNAYAQRGVLSVGNITSAIWSAYNITGVTGAVTVTYSNTMEAGTFFLSEFSGGGASATADTGAGANGTSASPATGAFVTVGGNDLLYQICGIDGNDPTFAATSPWVIPTNGTQTSSAGANMVAAVSYQLNKAAGSYNGQFSNSISRDWYSRAQGFKDSSTTFLSKGSAFALQAVKRSAFYRTCPSLFLDDRLDNGDHFTFRSPL